MKLKADLYGITRGGAGSLPDFPMISRLEETDSYDELIVSAHYLTPEWLKRMKTEVGHGIEVGRFNYARFAEISRYFLERDNSLWRRV